MISQVPSAQYPVPMESIAQTIIIAYETRFPLRHDPSSSWTEHPVQRKERKDEESKKEGKTKGRETKIFQSLWSHWAENQNPISTPEKNQCFEQNSSKLYHIRSQYSVLQLYNSYVTINLNQKLQKPNTQQCAIDGMHHNAYNHHDVT